MEGHGCAATGKGTIASITQFNRRIAPAGTRFYYASIEPDVLGVVLRYATGKSLSDYLQEKIWEPIGTEDDAKWLLDAEGFEVAHFGFNAVLRDYARLGRLLAHDGAWEGKADHSRAMDDRGDDDAAHRTATSRQEAARPIRSAMAT